VIQRHGERSGPNRSLVKVRRSTSPSGTVNRRFR